MRIKWFIAAAVLAYLGFVLYQAFGPSRRALLGNQTTYITAPLAADGLPDYALAIMQRQSQGVTPENNGAVLFWAAMGPGMIGPQEFPLVCRKIGVPPAALVAPLVPLDDKKLQERLRQWIVAEYAPAEEPAEQAEDASGAGEGPSSYDRLNADQALEDILAYAARAPWTAEEIPPLAEWMQANATPLNLLVEAAARPRFFSPSPNVLKDPTTSLIEMHLPHAQLARDAVRALLTRAMHRVGAKAYEEAWGDIRACWRLASHVGGGPTLVEKLVAIAIRGAAKEATLSLLQKDDVPIELLEQLRRDLETLPHTLDIADSINYGERTAYLDCVFRMLGGRFGGMSPETLVGGDFDIVAKYLSIDINIPLRQGNEWYDRMATVANVSDRAARMKAASQLYQDIEAVAADFKGKAAEASLSRSMRSKALGDLMLSLMLPAVKAAFQAEDRDVANLAMVRTAASLAIHRRRTGEYPATLLDLVPAELAALPIDPYCGTPLIYERRGDGYLLYSVWEDGADNGGDDAFLPIVKGEWVGDDADRDSSWINKDLVIRIPRPLRLPQPPTPEEPAADDAD